jgi:hypothetical protein
MKTSAHDKGQPLPVAEALRMAIDLIEHGPLSRCAYERMRASLAAHDAKNAAAKEVLDAVNKAVRSRRPGRARR